MLAKDLGLHMKRIGFTSAEHVLVIGVHLLMIIKYSDDHFSFSAPVGADESTYLATVDFNLETAMQLEPILGDRFRALLQPVKNVRLDFFVPENFYVNIWMALPEKENLVEVETEIYLPLDLRKITKGQQ